MAGTWFPPRVSRDYTRFNSTRTTSTTRNLRFGKSRAIVDYANDNNSPVLPSVSDTYRPLQRVLITAVPEDDDGDVNNPMGQMHIQYWYDGIGGTGIDDPGTPGNAFFSVQGLVLQQNLHLVPDAKTGIRNSNSGGNEYPGTFNWHQSSTWRTATKLPNGYYLWGAVGDDVPFTNQNSSTLQEDPSASNVFNVIPLEIHVFTSKDGEDTTTDVSQRGVVACGYPMVSIDAQDLGAIDRMWRVLYTENSVPATRVLVQRDVHLPTGFDALNIARRGDMLNTGTSVRTDAPAWRDAIVLELPSAFADVDDPATGTEAVSMASIAWNAQQHLSTRLGALEALLP